MLIISLSFSLFLSKKIYHIIRRVFGTGNYHVYENSNDITTFKSS